MTLHFIDRLPVLGYADVDDRTLAFAWNWHEPVLRITAADGTLLGHVTHLDALPRLASAPTGHAWLHQHHPARTRAVLHNAITLWRRKETLFRDCDG
ncbi:hypothetical protein [Glycomyces paridis]|uniref:Uncharacterized protein n=1 Tax=Glycomyces paridis TaxID=2126555 RepID=A0A4S8NZJ3_9ACTN|nr:hypothetical protein [Glycomyces paridis]THV21752.1 hypothetical protein E9998_24180 [Glycomyces paridis]